MYQITSRTAQLIRKYFTEDEIEFVISLLCDEAGKNLPFCENSTPLSLERIHFAILKWSRGSLDELESAIEVAKTDWRDLLVRTGFGSDLNAHSTWAENVLNSEHNSVQ